MPKLYFKVQADYDRVIKLREEIARLKSELQGMNSSQAPAAFNTLNRQLQQSTQELNGLTIKAAQAGAAFDNDLKKKIFSASQGVNDFTEKIIKQKGVVKDVEADVKKLSNAYRDSVKSNPMKSAGLLAELTAARKALDEEKASLFQLTQQQASARLSVKKLRDEQALYNEESNKSVEVTDLVGQSMKRAFVAMGGGYALKELLGNITKVRGEFQEMETSIKTLVGEDMANKLIPQIKELAKVSPLTMTDMVGAEKMMLGFNIEADKTVTYLKAMSDISMGDSQKFNSLTLAFSQMSAAGKLMGQDLNQMINAGFNPLQTIATRTGKSIAQLKDEMSKGAVSAQMVQQAFIDATSAGGKFYNMSANASKTINGQISMMEDAMDAAFNKIGTQSEGLIMASIQGTTALIGNYETVGKVIAGLAVTYGTYRAALLLNIALEKVQAVNRLSHIKNVAALKIATEGLTASLMKMNATLMANPFALAASAVMATSIALIYHANQLDKNTRAVEEFNSEQEALNKKESEHKEWLDKLISVAGDEAASTENRKKALIQLEDKYHDIFAKYKTEADMLNNILKIKKEIAKYDEDENSSKQNQSLADYDAQIAKLKKSIADASKSGGGYGVRSMQNDLNGLITKRNLLKSKIDKENADSVLSNLSGYSNAALQAEIKTRNKLIKDIEDNNKVGGKSNAGTVVGGIAGGTKFLSKLKAEKQAIERELNSRGKSSINKKYWEDKKKEAQAKLNALSDIKVKGKEGAALRKQIEGYDKELEYYSSSKLDTKAETLRKETEKYKVLLSKQTLEKIRTEEDLQNQVEQANIDAMKDGSDKTIAQQELNFEKEMQSIDRQKEDLLRKKIDSARSEWESNPKNKKKSFDASGISLSDEENTQFDSLYKAAIERQGNELEVLFKQYQGYLDKRNSIEKKYNADRDRLIANGANQATLDENDYQKKNALKAVDEEFAERDNQFKQWADKITDSTLEKLEELLKSAKDELAKMEAANPNDPKLAIARAKVNTLSQSISNGVVAKNNLSPSQKSLKKWQEMYSTLQKVSNEFDEIGNSVGGTAGKFISAAGQVATSTLSMIDGIKTVTNGTVMAMDETGKMAARTMTTIEKASVILTIISAAIQIFQQISSLFKDSYQQYEAYAEKVKEINALTDAVNDYRIAALEAQQAEQGWFSEDNLKNLRDYKALHDEIAKAYGDKVGESQAVYQNQSGGGWLTNLWKPVTGFIDSTWGKIWGFDINKDYKEGQTAAINNLRIETKKKSSGFLGTGIGGKSQKTEDLVTWAKNNGLGDLFDEKGYINKELAQSILDNYGSKLVGQTKETLESLVELKEKYDEYIDKLHEYVSSLYEPLVDNFVDGLWDWFDNGKDALDSFKDYASDTFRDIVSDMMRTIVLDKVVGSFSDDIAALYEEYADGTISETDLMKKVAEQTGAMIGRYEGAIPTLEGILNQVNSDLNKAGIDLKDTSSSSQNSTSKGYTTVSQDTGEEISGRLTGVQEEQVKHSEALTVLNTTANDIKGINSGIKDIATGIQDMMANSFLELKQISDNTGAIIKPIKEMRDDIAEIKKNTK